MGRLTITRRVSFIKIFTSQFLNLTTPQKIKIIDAVMKIKKNFLIGIFDKKKKNHFNPRTFEVKIPKIFRNFDEKIKDNNVSEKIAVSADIV